MTMLANLALDWLGVTLAYVFAAALAAGGGYLEFIVADNPFGSLGLGKFLRYVGKMLLIAGAILAAITFGKGLGLAACATDARLAELRAENGRLKLAAAMQSAASTAALSSMQTLARQKDELQNQIGDYADKARTLDACRRATGDDDRRMRAIIQGGENP